MHVVTYRASWSCSDVRPGCLLVNAHTHTSKGKKFAPGTRVAVVTSRFVTVTRIFASNLLLSGFPSSYQL
jgi:hypothetical protein